MGAGQNAYAHDIEETLRVYHHAIHTSNKKILCVCGGSSVRE